MNIKVENREPGIRIVSIDRPDALNALNTQTLGELRDRLREASQDASVRVLILTGTGEKAFIAGADISEMKDKSVPQAVEFARLGHEVAKLLELMPKPTIAAVNGFALGGGTEMAIACDFIIASERAVFGLPEVSLGVIPGFGATIRLSKVVGDPLAKELIYTGRRMKADEAKLVGLANQVYAPDVLMSKVLEMAEIISRNSAHAITRAKSLLNELSEVSGLNYKIDLETMAFGSLFGGGQHHSGQNAPNDQREGMNAFIEKRKPKFI